MISVTKATKMLRLWNFLIYGETKSSVWEMVKHVDVYEEGAPPGARPYTAYLMQQNQYGRCRKVYL
jgi:hypothetical protein